MLAFLLTLALAHGGDLYLGTDSNGVITITDSPTRVSGFSSLLPVDVPQTQRLPRAIRESRYDNLILTSARKWGIQPALVKAVCLAESGMNPQAVSHAGAMGLMQLMPKTARGMNILEPFDPASSIDGGARFLSKMIEMFGSTRLALAAYNAGPARVKAAGGIPQIPETVRYVEKVMTYYRFYIENGPIGFE